MSALSTLVSSLQNRRYSPGEGEQRFDTAARTSNSTTAVSGKTGATAPLTISTTKPITLSLKEDPLEKQSGGSVARSTISTASRAEVESPSGTLALFDPGTYLSALAGRKEKTSFQEIAQETLESTFGSLKVGDRTVSERAPYLLPSIALLGSVAAPDPLMNFGDLAKSRNFLKALTSETDPAKVAGILRGRGVAEDLVTEYAPILSRTKTQAETKKAIDALSQLSSGSKAAPVVPPPKKPRVAPESRERGFLTSVKEEVPQVGTRVSGQYIPRDTDELAIKAKNFIADDIVGAEAKMRAGTDDEAVAIAAELIKKYSDDAARATDPAIANTLYDKAAEVANSTAAKLTESGRSVQAAAILGRMTPEGQLRFAAREIQRYNEGAKVGAKIPELTAEQTAKITTEMRRIQALPDGVDKARAFHKLQDYIAALVPSPLFKKLITVWKAGLLTGLKTSGLNIFSNLFHGVSEVAKDIPAVAVDSVASLFTGRRTVAGTGRGTFEGVKEGFEKGWDYFKTGFSERDIGAKLDYHKVNFGKGKFPQAVQAYEETVFRAIGAQDQPFYYGAKSRSMYSQALAEAKNQGLSGDEALRFAEELISNPTDDMVKYATLDAETAVFQNSTVLGKLGKELQASARGAGEIIVPFAKTPSAVITQLWNYSPVGIVSTIAEQIARKQFDQRLFSQAVGRGLTGTALLYLGSKLYENDLINLSFPTSPREREQWELEGRKPNTIKVGDQYRSVATLGPAGLVLVVGGQYQKALKETGSHFNALVQAFAGAAKSVTEQSFLRGVNQAIEAISDPARSFKGFFSGLIASIVPTIVSDVSRATDDVERRSEGITDRLKSRVPGLRQTLEPQVNTLGQNIETPNFLTTMLDPTRPSEVSDDPVVLELRRLWDAGEKVSPTQLGDKAGFKVLTPEQNTALWTRAGELTKGKLNGLIQMEQYQSAADDQKADAIEKIVAAAKLLSRAEATLQLTEGLSGDGLKDELARLKEGGLLTRDVYNRWLEIR